LSFPKVRPVSLGKRAANSVVLALPVKSTGVPILKKY
jgi:hypothetical protein